MKAMVPLEGHKDVVFYYASHNGHLSQQGIYLSVLTAFSHTAHTHPLDITYNLRLEFLTHVL